MDYDEENGEYEFKSWKEFVKSHWYWIAIILYVVIWSYMNWGIDVTMGSQWRNSLVAMLFIALIGTAWFGAWKKTPKIVWNGGQSTWTGRRIVEGNYVIIPLGGVRAAGVDIFTGSAGHLVLPATAENLVGDNLAVTISADPTHIKKLPLDIQEKIIAWNLNGPIFAGYCDPNQLNEAVSVDEVDRKKLKIGVTTTGELKKVDTSYLITALKISHELNSTLNNIIKGKHDAIESVVGSMTRITNKAKSEKSLGQKAMDAMTKED